MIEGHGDDLYKYGRPVKVNFSSNLTNWIDPAPLRTFLSERVGEVLSVYPEPSPFTLEARLARLLRLSPDNICVTSGATEAIYLVAQSYARSRSAVMQPTFSEYADACRIHGHRVSSLYQWPAHGHLPADVRMVWLCNPNNPTGGVWEKDFLLAQIQKNPDVLFVIDQSYEAFTLAPLFSAREASEMPNVLLLHSLTKRYAMPGLRLGYLTGPASLGMPGRERAVRVPAPGGRRMGCVGFGHPFLLGSSPNGVCLCPEGLPDARARASHPRRFQFRGAGQCLFPCFHPAGRR